MSRSIQPLLASLLLGCTAQPSPLLAPLAPVRAPGLVGRVTAHGAPLAGAWLAAVPEVNAEEVSEESTRPAALVQTALDGSYRLDGIAPGTYALTLTTSAATAHYLSGQVIQAGRPPRDVPLQIADVQGQVVLGVLRDAQGQPYPRGTVRAVRLSDERGDIFYGKTDASGRFLLRLPPANYLIVAFAPGLETEPLFVDLREADQQVELSFFPTPRPASAEVKGWIQDRAARLSGVEAGHDHRDLLPFSAMVGDATVVSLGEATHGTREFFQLKQRLFEHLVMDLGFRVFAIEANLPEAFAVDEYLQTGKGDPVKLLGGLYFWTWNTEEVLELIRWMRSYNAEPEHREKLHFYGFDLQFSEQAISRALDYLKKTDPSWVPPEALHRMTDPCSTERDQLPADQAERVAAVAALERRLDEERTALLRRSTPREWELSRQYARVAAQQLALNGTGNLNGQRDRAMAENVRWIQARERGAKMVLWAHNAHIADVSYVGGRSMGQWLRDALGPKVLTVGFTFDQGSFRAIEMPVQSNHGVRDFEVSPAVVGSVAAELASLGLDRALIDLRALPAAGAARAWFDAGRPFRDFESTHRVPGPGEPANGRRLRVTKAFDVLAFLKDTHASYALPWGRGRLLPPGRTPLNLDFEDGLAAWFLPDVAPAFDFELTAVNYGAKSGQRAALLRRAPGPHLGAYCARLSQRVEAQAYAGRPLRLKLWAEARKLRGPAPHVWLSAQGVPGAAPARQEVGLKTDEGWQALELHLEVPPGASFISYGLAFSGEGEVLLDGLQLEQP